MVSARILFFMTGLLALVTLGSVSAQLSLPQLQRFSVRTTPHILGRQIERIVVSDDIYVPFIKSYVFTQHDVLQVIPAGQLIPVSEDAKGVFYQAARGLDKFLTYDVDHPMNVPGGLYLSKTKADAIYPYFGDARKLDLDIRQYIRPLPPVVTKKLLIGEIARRH